MQKVDIIYTRYSSDMQRAESCEDQEREVRQGLSRKGIKLDSVEVIRDQAESGTKSDRAGYQQLQRYSNAKVLRLLAVDDLSRLSRAENAYAFIKDLVFQGGRFISVSENIDTLEQGWELKIKVLDLHHGETIRGLKEKVQRGQRGRVIDGGSAGDFPFGYESYYLDADWQQQLARRGPKPKKGLRIFEAEAVWVRQIFAWFVEGMSIGKIARELTNRGVDKGHRATKRGWHPQQVRRLLANEKYIGRWMWGATTTIRNSAGKKKQIATDEAVICDRPELRILEQTVWEQAQTRLQELAQQFGYQPGHAKRGAKSHVNPAQSYPRSLLGGILCCQSCGQPMWYKGSGGRRYYVCSGAINNRCPMRFQVPAEAAETAVIDALTRLVGDWPEWLQIVHRQLLELLRQAAERLPQEQQHDQEKLVQLQSQLGRLVDELARGLQSSAVATRIIQLEAEIALLEQRLATRQLPTATEIERPTEEWVRQQLNDWVTSLADTSKLNAVLRKALERIEARPIVVTGKKRGTVELTLHYRDWALFQAALGKQLPPSVQSLLPTAADDAPSQTATIRLGEPTLMDQWTPQIVQWRAEKIPWTEIVRRTGLDLNRVYIAWKRFTDAQANGEP